jgi:hypothetical protein
MCIIFKSNTINRLLVIDFLNKISKLVVCLENISVSRIEEQKTFHIMLTKEASILKYHV